VRDGRRRSLQGCLEACGPAGAQIPGVACADRRTSEGWGGSYPFWDDQQFRRILESATAAPKQADATEVEVVKVTVRNPSADIVDYADKNGFDHIVVGTPRRGVARFVLGSVAAEIVAKAHCPVSVAR
jgi:nucleotide-binding universal stress UspA family protein